MLVVKLEIWPWGNESKKREIGRVYIANKGDGDREKGNYKVAVNRRNRSEPPNGNWTTDNPTITRVGEVLDYPRLKYNVWRLISRALRSAFPEEK